MPTEQYLELRAITRKVFCFGSGCGFTPCDGSLHEVLCSTASASDKELALVQLVGF